MLTSTKADVEEWNSNRDPEIRTFASGQYLCELSYFLSHQDPLPNKIKVLNEDGKYYSYHVKPIPLKEGMFAYILIPTHRDKCQNVKILFRGTDFTDLNSARINVEQGGPGVSSFEEEKDKMFACLKETLEDFPTDSLSFYGHSQGSSLAQLFISEFLERQYLHDDFLEVHSLSLTGLNSPGIPPYYVNKADYYAKALKEINPSNKIVVNWGMVGGDPVQQTGLDMLFAHTPSEIVEVNLFKIDRGLEKSWSKEIIFKDGLDLSELIQIIKNLIGTFKAHENVNFFAPAITDEYGRIIVDLPKEQRLFYSNQTLEGAMMIRAEILNKILNPSYGFYLLTESLGMLDLGYLGDFIPDSVYQVGKKILKWFKPNIPEHFQINDHKILTYTDPKKSKI